MRGGSARALVLRALLLLAIAAVPVAFNAWIDPARLVARRDEEAAIARVLASGRNVTDYANYDDRAIERTLVTLRRGRPDVLALGSSRMQPMPAAAFPGERFVNGAMQGALIDDLYGIYGLYDTDARRPRRVVLEVDPWTESFLSGASWTSVRAERAAVMRRAGIPVSRWRDESVLAIRLLKRLASPEYFRLAVYSFRRYGARGLPWVATDRAQNREKTKLPDGSIVWASVTEDAAVARARMFAEQRVLTNPLYRRLDAKAPGREDALERFVRYMRGEGVDVTLLLVPFPPEMYDAFARFPDHGPAAVERSLRSMAARTGIEVRGSYDPRPLGITTREFFDESHLRPEALVRLVR